MPSAGVGLLEIIIALSTYPVHHFLGHYEHEDLAFLDDCFSRSLKQMHSIPTSQHFLPQNVHIIWHQTQFLVHPDFT